MSGVLLSGEIWTEIHRGKMDRRSRGLPASGKASGCFWMAGWERQNQSQKKKKVMANKKESISETGVQGKHSGIEDTCLAAEGSWKGLRIGSPDKRQDAQLNVNFRYGMNTFLLCGTYLS